MKEYGCGLEMNLGAICSSANNFLCEDCTEKLIKSFEALDDDQSFAPERQTRYTADATPELLEACELALIEETMSRDLHDMGGLSDRTIGKLRAAIAKAKAAA